MDFSQRPAYLLEHGDNIPYRNIMEKRIRILENLKKEFRVCPKYRKIAIQMLGEMDPPRQYYDYMAALRIYRAMQGIPFRKDIHEVETIQYPDITLEHGGDCDCLVLAASVLLESVGVETRWFVSKQNDSDYDHIALYLPTIGAVFDLTVPGKIFPLVPDQFNESQVI